MIYTRPLGALAGPAEGAAPLAAARRHGAGPCMPIYIPMYTYLHYPIYLYTYIPMYIYTYIPTYIYNHLYTYMPTFPTCPRSATRAARRWRPCCPAARWRAS